MVQSRENHGVAQTTCVSCGRAMPETARFCPHCGHRLEIKPGTCAHCGAAMRPDASFCPNCGSAAASTASSVTVEAVSDRAEVEYMGFWIRFAAAVIDGVITGIVGGIVDAVVGFFAIGTILSVLYYVLFTGLKGQTPGKMALGIMVVDQRGNVPGIGRAALREILGKLVSTIVILLGFLWIGWDRRKRGWHDHISGTYVVRKQRDRGSSF